MIYGLLNYNDEQFIFNLENEYLNMENIDDVGQQGIYINWFNNIPSFSGEYIKGVNAENGRIILFKPSPGVAGFKNTKLKIKIQYYIELKSERPINMLSIKCDELNYFFDISKGIEEYDFNEEGKTSCRTKSFAETTSELESFNLDEKSIDFNFSIYRGIKFKSCTPLKLNSSVNFHFEETDDYDFLVKIYRLFIAFLSFICYRKNIGNCIIDLYCKGEKSSHENVGCIIFPKQDVQKESEKIIKERHLEYNSLCGNIGQIIQDIEDDRLYLRHIPQSHHDSLQMDYSKFIMLTAAIEWIFKNEYPEGLKHRTATIEAIEEIKTELNEKINNSAGKKKDIYKFLNKVVDSVSLSQMITQICNDNDEVFRPFGDYIYGLNNQKHEFKYNKLGDRISSQRNNFAHGNIGKDFDVLSVLDIIFIEKAIYIMQLKKYCPDNESIISQIKNLFGLRF